MAAMKKANLCVLAIALLSSCGTLHHSGCASAFSVSQCHHTKAKATVARTITISALHATKQSNNAASRRQLLHGAMTTAILSSSTFLVPNLAQAAQTPLPLQTTSGTTIRVEEIGSGLDILSPPPLSSSEVFYPSSMTNTNWRVQRVLTSVEGDLGQAGLAWKLLGGSDERAFTSKLTEVYEQKFIAAPEEMKDSFYDYDGKVLQAAISDRGQELSSRIGLEKDSISQWNTKSNSIEYTRNNKEGAVSLTVAQRRIEPPSDYTGNKNEGTVTLPIAQRKIKPPSDSGFGSDEVYRIRSSAGGIFAGTNVDRAARVRRRFRRGFDEVSGKRILDCIEIVTTHRVMDGVAGMEFPTSTCKSILRLTQL